MEPQSVTAPQTTENAHASLIPESWPGSFGIFKVSKAAFKVNLGVNLTFLILAFLTQVSVRSPGHVNSGLLIVGLIVGLIGIVLSVAQKVAALASARNQKISFGQAFPKDLMIYVNFFVLSILVGLSELISLLLLIVPFFFVYPRLALASYYLVDKNLGPVEAYKASWNETKTYKGKVWGIVGVAFLFAVLCLLLVGIYLLVVYSLANVLLYLYISTRQTPKNAK